MREIVEAGRLARAFLLHALEARCTPRAYAMSAVSSLS